MVIGNKNGNYLLCVIDVFSKYIWAKRLKENNKIMQEWLDKNNNNEGKSVIT